MRPKFLLTQLLCFKNEWMRQRIFLQNSIQLQGGIK